MVRIAEFQGKIEASCKTRVTNDFLAVAPTEALIAGFDQNEAFSRASPIQRPATRAQGASGAP